MAPPEAESAGTTSSVAVVTIDAATFEANPRPARPSFRPAANAPRRRLSESTPLLNGTTGYGSSSADAAAAPEPSPPPLKGWAATRKALGDFLTSPRTKAVLLVLVFADLASTLTEMIIALYTSPEEQEELEGIAIRLFDFISNVIMGVFVTELVLNVIVFGIGFYFESFLNFIDGFVTLTSFLLTLALSGQAENAASLLIGLRIWRIIDFMQGVTETVQERFEPLCEALDDDIESLDARATALKDDLAAAVPDRDRLAQLVEHSLAPAPSANPVEEFIQDEAAAARKRKSALKKFLDSPTTETWIVGLVVIDLLFVTAGLLISLFTTPDEEKEYFGEVDAFLNVASLAILAVFVAEVAAKLYAFGVKRFTDDWIEALDGLWILFFLSMWFF
ncbi:hypothetical protein DFJ73DRAFT_517007 [Zopfochytrium polystomum]|nr:hypothetical protein DFJ73DRAFT_517007 [Zopfochytrium polystomum]